MDLRMKKTLAAIRNAFIELRSHKPLEKITIKELTEKAEISKATFYLHYQDVYDLSSSIQEEVIDEVFSNIENPETILSDTEGFTRTLFYATSASKALIDTGTEQRVITVDNEGRFVPKQVAVFHESQGLTAIRSGLTEGEKVVSSGLFLIDSEANISGALDRMRAQNSKAQDAAAMPAQATHSH